MHNIKVAMCFAWTAVQCGIIVIVKVQAQSKIDVHIIIITDLRSFKTQIPPQNKGTAATASCIPRAS
jgi:hypothetical protein